MPAEPLRLAWFATARGSGSLAMFRATQTAIERGDLRARIVVVFCNRDPAEAEPTDRFLGEVRAHGVPAVTLSSVRFRKGMDGERSRPGEPLPEWRRAFDARVAELLTPYRFDVGVLAGYMLITTDVLCDRYVLLNLHPALPGGPVGTWQEVLWQLIAARAGESGVMINRATVAVDRGPVVSFCRYSLRGPDLDALWTETPAGHAGTLAAALGESHPLFVALRARGLRREGPFLVETLRALADGRVALREGAVLDRDGGTLPTGLDLSGGVETALAGDFPGAAGR